MGYNVTIILVSTGKRDSVYEVDKRISVVPLCEGYTKKVNFIKRVKLLTRCFKKINPDVIISFLPHICIYSFFASRRLKIPLICSERNNPNQYNLLYKILLRKAFSYAAGCVFQTTEAMSFYGDKISKKSTIINNPINPKFLLFKSPQDRKKVIISAGRLEPQKQYDLLIESFYLFVNANPGYILKIYGNGSQKEHLMNLITKKQLINKVFLMGSNERWYETEYDSSIFVMTSAYEGMPNALAEALVLGIPSVSTDCPVGGPRKLSQYCNYLILSDNNPINIAGCMEKCITKNNTDNTEIKKALDVKLIAQEWLSFISRKVLSKNE